MDKEGNTEMRFILCTWFGEFCSCCSLTPLPGPAWVLLNWICKELISSLFLLRTSQHKVAKAPEMHIIIYASAKLISHPFLYLLVALCGCTATAHARCTRCTASLSFVVGSRSWLREPRGPPPASSASASSQDRYLCDRLMHFELL